MGKELPSRRMMMGAQAVRLTNVDIDNALSNNHFEVIFQPIFQLSDGTLLRMEAFVRWVHPGLGVLPPGAFISFFENQGRMSELTRYVISAALAGYKSWRGSRGPGFSVNLAHSDLLDESFPEWLTQTLAENDFPAASVTLECPSLPANVPPEEAASYFHRLKETGCKLAIEVRGRANEMLQTISPFPFDEVKTGGSAILRFARTVRGGPGLTAISDLLELAKKNDARTVAVGVEDHASLQALASLGFIAAQGNYLAGVGDVRSFAMSSINQVRKSLSLPELEQADLIQLVDGEEALALSATEMVSTPEENTKPAAAPANEMPAENIGAEETHAPAAKAAEAPLPVEPESDADAAEQAEAKAEKLKAAKIAALKKKKAAQVAAKKRAQKIAAEKKAAAEKAQIELEEKQRALKEAEAARAAEDNARKLQDRLSQAYEDPSRHTAAEEEAAPEAGLLLGGSLAETALNTQPATQAQEASSPVGTPEVSPEDVLAEDVPAEEALATASVVIKDAPVPPSADLSDAQKDLILEAPEPKPTAPEAPKNDFVFPSIGAQTGFMGQPSKPAPKPAPVKEFKSAPRKIPRLRVSFDPEPITYGKKQEADDTLSLSFASQLKLSAIEKEQPGSASPAPVSTPDSASAPAPLLDAMADPQTAMEPLEEIILDEIAPEADYKLEYGEQEAFPETKAATAEEISDIALPELLDSTEVEEDFRPEDERLDEAFKGSAVLDPMDHHTEEDNGLSPSEPIHSTETDIAARLARKSYPRKRKNFLQRKYRITHFWPRRWKASWDARKAQSAAAASTGGTIGLINELEENDRA